MWQWYKSWAREETIGGLKIKIIQVVDMRFYVDVIGIERKRVVQEILAK